MPCLFVNLRKIKQQQTAGGLIHQTFLTKKEQFLNEDSSTEEFKDYDTFKRLNKANLKHGMHNYFE